MSEPIQDDLPLFIQVIGGKDGVVYPIQDDIETLRDALRSPGPHYPGADAALDRLVAERDDLLKRWDEAVVQENLAVAERDRLIQETTEK